MCCCIFFPSLNTRNQFFFLFFFTFGFSDQNTFSLSLFLCFPRPSLFFPSFPPSSFILSLSFALSQCSCSLAWSRTLVWWTTWTFSSWPVCILVCSGLCCPPSLSHSGLFICDMHFGITHLVPHHCAPALIVFLGENSQHNCRGALAFLWPGCLSGCFHSLKQTFCPWQTCLSYGWEKGCRVASKQTRQTCWTKGSGNPPPPTDSLCSALAQLVIISTRVPVYSNVQ